MKLFRHNFCSYVEHVRSISIVQLSRRNQIRIKSLVKVAVAACCPKGNHLRQVKPSQRTKSAKSFRNLIRSTLFMSRRDKSVNFLNRLTDGVLVGVKPLLAFILPEVDKSQSERGSVQEWFAVPTTFAGLSEQACRAVSEFLSSHSGRPELAQTHRHARRVSLRSNGPRSSAQS